MQREEALQQIEYMKSLIAETRMRVATGYQFFYLWGAIWVVGYLGAWRLDEKQRGIAWAVLIPTGSMASMLLGRWLSKRGKHHAPTASLGDRLAWMNLVLIAGLVVLPALFFGGVDDPGVDLAYPPFVVGFIYVVNGIFLGRSLLIPGAWILGVTMVTFALSYDAAALWMAVAGGGGLLASGEWLRRESRSAR